MMKIITGVFIGLVLFSSLLTSNSFAQYWYDEQKKCEAKISKDSTSKEKLVQHNYCKKLTESYLKSHDKYGEQKPPKEAQARPDTSHEPTYVHKSTWKIIGNMIVTTDDNTRSKWCKDSPVYCDTKKYLDKCQKTILDDNSLSPSMKRAKLKECAYDAGLRESTYPSLFPRHSSR